MKKKLTLALATVMAVSSLTACNNQPRTESDIRAEIAKLESELNNASGNSDNAEDTSTSTASNAPSSVNPYFDYGEYIHADPDRDPPVVSVPEQEYQYPDMFDVLPYIDETPVSKFEYKYNISLRGMEITSYKGQSPKIRVPETIEGEPVVMVDLGEFREATHLYLPDTVEQVEGYCGFLEYTNIPSAFDWSKSEYDWYFEDYNWNLKSIYFNYGLNKIGYKALFASKTFELIEKIYIPDSVIEIGEYALQGCPNAEFVYKDKTYSYNELSTLRDDINYTDGIKIVNSVLQSVKEDYIGDLIIPDGVTEIGTSAFSHCSGLTSVSIPDSVTEIGSDAFRDCTGLTSITIPDSVTKIGIYAFSGCTSLTNVAIPNGISEIINWTFMDCRELTSITIPNSVTYIGFCAFAECERLTSISIPDSVTYIGDLAFVDCSRLTNVIIPDSVTEIGYRAFADCENIKATYKCKTYTYDQIKDLYDAING
ncbi:MAG: leucine-rich repeat domain-containing protein [Oscillospiraceae bacterium]|nr:leucine-rich repeat domain-containing protein [Oscillospiraceae bacterium]